MKNTKIGFVFNLLGVLFLAPLSVYGQKDTSFSWAQMDKNRNRDSIITLLKSSVAKKMAIKRITQSFEWQKPIFNEDRLPLNWCSYIIIPTLKMDSSKLVLDSLQMPLEIMVYFAGRSVGYYRSTCEDDFFNWEGNSKLNCGYFLRHHKFNTSRYDSVKQDDIGAKIKSLKADMIFSIKSIYHHYFYYKNNQLFVIELNTLNTYTIREYYDKYVKQKN